VAKVVRQDGTKAVDAVIVIDLACRDLDGLNVRALRRFAAAVGLHVDPFHKASKKELCAQVIAGLHRVADEATRPGFFKRLYHSIQRNMGVILATGGLALTGACRTNAFRDTRLCMFWNEFGEGLWSVFTSPFRGALNVYREVNQMHYEQALGLKEADLRLRKVDVEKLEKQIELVAACTAHKRAMMDQVERKLRDPSWLSCVGAALGVAETGVLVFAKAALFSLGLTAGAIANIGIHALEKYLATNDPRADVEKLCGALADPRIDAQC
jgi:hypothetical protein